MTIKLNLISKNVTQLYSELKNHDNENFIKKEKI